MVPWIPGRPEKKWKHRRATVAISNLRCAHGRSANIQYQHRSTITICVVRAYLNNEKWRGLQNFPFEDHHIFYGFLKRWKIPKWDTKHKKSRQETGRNKEMKERAKSKPCSHTFDRTPLDGYERSVALHTNRPYTHQYQQMVYCYSPSSYVLRMHAYNLHLSIEWSTLLNITANT